MDPVTPEQYFTGSRLGLEVFRCLDRRLRSRWPDVTARTARSQVAFRRRRSFAFLWRPGLYLHAPDADVVLSIALPALIESNRFKEVVRPREGTWMHHLEIRAVGDVDEEVEAWLDAAAVAAGAVRDARGGSLRGERPSSSVGAAGGRHRRQSALRIEQSEQGEDAAQLSEADRRVHDLKDGK